MDQALIFITSLQPRLYVHRPQISLSADWAWLSRICLSAERGGVANFGLKSLFFLSFSFLIVIF